MTCTLPPPHGLTHADLFSGIGGWGLAAKRAGMVTKWFCENEPYASAVLKKHWPDVPNHGDITKLRGSDVEHVDVLTGSFPCQDISLIGKGAGITGAQSGLWKHYDRIIEEGDPTWVVIENVAALRARGLDTVLRDLDALGFWYEGHCVPASAIGAKHRRDRIWITARKGEPVYFSDVANAERARLEGHSRHDRYTEWKAASGPAPKGSVCGGEHTFHGGILKPFLGREIDGLRRRLDPVVAGWRDDSWESGVPRITPDITNNANRLRCIGNSIVPQVAEVFLRAITAYESALAHQATGILTAA